ncbi:hypothetical protein AMCSP02_001138 [Streptococcus pneumoniae 2061617]|nr:hypothetical protein AMCSP02_001138 [Streptococcus pneumoniae 2061617]EJG74088.1 hypothetical protein AMCSP19_001069 [Streptococcus pneumoniae 2082239]
MLLFISRKLFLQQVHLYQQETLPATGSSTSALTALGAY